MRSILRSSSARLAFIAFSLFFTVSFLSRMLLTLKSIHDVSWDFSLLGSFTCGAFFDIAAGFFAAALWLLGAVLVPSRCLKSKLGQLLIIVFMTLFASLLIFITTAEWFFWDEFGVRFNFIAVDYLIFTQEVLGNIFESYPMGVILAGIGLLAAGIVWGLRRLGAFRWALAYPSSIRQRLILGGPGLAIPTAAFWLVSQSWVPTFSNQYHGELAKNGCWSFFAAARKMELNYDDWYRKYPQDEMLSRAKNLLVTPNEIATSSSQKDVLTRSIRKSGPEKRWNVILVCMESLSADFMSYAGSKEGITPNLDRLAGESVFFERLYATGTRTVRGMEALTLNLPPTPGQSIIYRPEGRDLVTTFSPFLKRGYDCGFFYGGDGKFDYMNRFFSTSGCRIMDVNAWDKKDVTFKTSWGACDEDLFNKTLSEADKAYASGKPFNYFCMTTSNHRPYDFPEGRIDLKSHSGRYAAVKYSDWAVGKLIEDASKKPWFKDTLIVFSADHCASSAGKSDLDVTKFHIPAMIYNPILVPAQKVSRLCSQVDVMPTVFGMLNWSYDTLGFGHDVLAKSHESPGERAFISNYQKIALLSNDSLAILKPKQQNAVYACDLQTGALTPSAVENPKILQDAVSYYQSASWLFSSGKLRKTSEAPVIAAVP
jgi:phosphoglycerol transferase MdoB-like AlkP superfamily enzyme